MLDTDEIKQVRDLSELEVRRYFDHYLQNVVPKQMEEVKKARVIMIQNHDADPEAHGAVEKKLNKMIFVIMGVAGAGGGLGAVAAKLMEYLGSG